MKYEMIIYWSDEDDTFVAEFPQLPGCMAHGSSQDAALRNALEAVGFRLETAKETGDPIPTPRGGRLIFVYEARLCLTVRRRTASSWSMGSRTVYSLLRYALALTRYIASGHFSSRSSCPACGFSQRSRAAFQIVSK